LDSEERKRGGQEPYNDESRQSDRFSHNLKQRKEGIQPAGIVAALKHSTVTPNKYV
jgi:hypothetical protein